MTNAIQSELLKLISRRMLLVVATLIALSAFATAFLPPVLSDSIAFDRDLLLGSWGVASFGFFLLLVFSCSVTGYEYKSKTYSTLTVRGSTRAELIGAKLLGLAAVACAGALLTGLMLALGWWLGGLAGGYTESSGELSFTGSEFGPLSWSQGFQLWAEALARVAVAYTAITVLGVMLGTVLRSTSAAIIAGLGAMFFVEGAITAVANIASDDVGWLPLFFQTLTVVAFGGEDANRGGNGGVPAPFEAYFTLAVWLAAFIGAAVGVFRVRDIA